MKKSYLMLVVFVLIIAALGLSSSRIVGVAQSSVDPTPNADSAHFFLPFVNLTRTYTIYGKVSGPDGQPVGGVSIIDQAGNQTLTNADGTYNLKGLVAGKYSLAAQKEGWLFNPTATEIEMLSSNMNVNIQAVTACEEAILNGSFEEDSAWQFPETTYSASYSTDAAHTGSHSARTGILNSTNNRYAYSSTRQLVTIPSDTVSANLRVWLYPISDEVLSNAQALESLHPLASRPAGAEFETEALAGDVQYVLILDPGPNPVDPVDDTLIETLLWMRSDAQQWQMYNFDISKYAGTTIKVQIGTYNDGVGGVSAMYADDVSLELCNNGSTPPPAPTCDNIIPNPGFEYFSDWSIVNTAYPASYSTARANSGLQSMRTGIVNSAANRYSYSDAYQLITIPSDADQAILGMHMYSQSGEVTTTNSAEKSLPAVPTGLAFGNAVLSSDVQYVLILNQYGYILETLVWQLKNNQSWDYQEFDLLPYKGQTIRLQFGTYNDGYSGISAMYFDDVTLDVCDATPTPTPTPTTTPPPGTCTEKFSNLSFENDNAWGIPITAFTAGYTTNQAKTGSRSMRTGIEYVSHNRYSYSDAYQSASIPLASTSATLEMHIYPMSTELITLALADRPTATLLSSQALSGDVQYVLVLDWYGNWIDTLLWQRKNTQVWELHSFDLSRYAGDYVRVQFGTYNDGWGGVTAMYVDDASLQLCP